MPEPHSQYMDRLMRRESFAALWPLFAKATQPAKEMTESFSALVHLRPSMKRLGSCRGIHVGDGAHARTAALFALKSDSLNISVDPIINEGVVRSWQDEYQIERFSWRRSRIQDAMAELNAMAPKPTVVTFVHAHVNSDDVLSEIRWDAAFILACCSPSSQFTHRYTPHAHGKDWGVLSVERRFQVLINPDSDSLDPSQI